MSSEPAKTAVTVRRIQHLEVAKGVAVVKRNGLVGVWEPGGSPMLNVKVVDHDETV